MWQKSRNQPIFVFVTSRDSSPITVTFPIRPPIDPEALRTDAVRVAAVRDTLLLDTAPEEVFDRLTALTARLLNVPVTFLALIDSDRDYHKSRHVFGQAQYADLVIRGRTLCQYTMVSSTPVVINDAAQYPLYRDIPSVRDNGVRAFAGVPLTTIDGQRIGTFCAVDFQPKEWSERDLETLTELAHAALREINLRQSLRRTEENAQAARSAARMREEVLAVVAHDLQNPLEVIRSSAESLVASPQYADDNTTVQRMKGAAVAVQTLVADLLEVSKIRQGRTIVRQSRIPPHELLRDAMLIMQPIADRSGVSIINDAPPGPRDVVIDYERILRVLANLIAQCIRSCPPDGTITLHAQHDRGTVKFSVAHGAPETDTSTGTAERLPAFNRFWQDISTASTPSMPGPDLGLAIARDIVEAHSGETGVDERADAGSTFYFILPTV